MDDDAVAARIATTVKMTRINCALTGQTFDEAVCIRSVHEAIARGDVMPDPRVVAARIAAAVDAMRALFAQAGAPFDEAACHYAFGEIEECNTVEGRLSATRGLDYPAMPAWTNELCTLHRCAPADARDALMARALRATADAIAEAGNTQLNAAWANLELTAAALESCAAARASWTARIVDAFGYTGQCADVGVGGSLERFAERAAQFCARTGAPPAVADALKHFAAPRVAARLLGVVQKADHGVALRQLGFDIDSALSDFVVLLDRPGMRQPSAAVCVRLGRMRAIAALLAGAPRPDECDASTAQRRLAAIGAALTALCTAWRA